MAKALVFLLFASQASCATRVVDVLYNAQGQKANGLLVLEWPSYTTITGRAVAGSRRSIRISNGIIDLTLEPTIGATPGGVTISARFTFTGAAPTVVERWNVPDTTIANLATLRLALPSGAGQALATLAFEDEIPIGAKDGTNKVFVLAKASLPNSLSLFRNGIRYANGTDYAINHATRTITLTVGATAPGASDTFRAQYMSGAGSVFATSAGSYVDAETPTGVLNGFNWGFSLSRSPIPASSLVLIRNGITLSPGVDYTLSGSTINFLPGAIPEAGDVLRAWFRY